MCTARLDRFPITCTATFPIVKPALSTSRLASRMNTSPCAPLNRGSSVPNAPPMSPRPAADSRASVMACATASPSLCPASPGSPGQWSPASHSSAPSSNPCVSVPTPMRGPPPRRETSSSARRRSQGVVILNASGSPGTTLTRCPDALTSAASSVASSAARAYASRRSTFGNPWGVCTAESEERSTVSTMSPRASTRLTVSLTGRPGITPCPRESTSATTRSKSPDGVSARAAS